MSTSQLADPALAGSAAPLTAARLAARIGIPRRRGRRRARIFRSVRASAARLLALEVASAISESRFMV